MSWPWQPSPALACASSGAVLGQSEEKKTSEENATYFIIFSYLAQICEQRLHVQKEMIRLYGHLLEDIGMCSAAGATPGVTVRVRLGEENTRSSLETCTCLATNPSV